MTTRPFLTRLLPLAALFAFAAVPVPLLAKAAKPAAAAPVAPVEAPAPAPVVEAAPLKVGLASSADPRVTAAGMAILRQGGSAVDAAMAMMLALTVVEPQSSGIGGGGFLMLHDAATGTTASIDGRETAPADATADRFLAPDGQPMPFMQAVAGGRSVGVPGNIRLMALAHARWGKLPWADLFEPAIQLAEDGFAVSPRLAAQLARVAPLWDRFPAARAIYWQDGAPAVSGATVKNPALAQTFTRLAEMGPDGFYAGQTAQEMVNAITGSPVAPGDMTMLDLTAYAAKERPPVCAPYRVYTICGMGPPSSGATTVLGILGMLERFDLRKLGKDNVTSWHLIAEAMRLAYADREAYLADADFIDVPVEGLLDPAYLKQRSALISPKKALGTYPAGSPKAAEPRTEAVSGEVAGTSHFVSIDPAGNVASMTSTIEGPFGSQIVTGGFFLNNELTDFTHAPERDGAPVANRVEGGKRPLSSMAPTIVYDAAGKPVFTVGAAGGKTIIMQVTKALIAHLDWGLTATDAIGLPLIYFNRAGETVLEADTTLTLFQPGLEQLGHKVAVADLPLKANAAELTATGWTGAADPRSEGTASAQ